MYQDWLKRYEEIANKRKDNIRTEDYCPTCGRKLTKIKQVIYKYLKRK